MPKFEEVVKGIYVLKAPFSNLWTGITLIRGDKNYLIDSGADSPEVYLIPALTELGLKISDVDVLLNTHCHGDHITGHYELAEKYGLNTKVVYPHSFRHRFAKNFLDRFNDIALLADLMGHESIETTRIYLRRTATEQKQIVDKIVNW